MHSQQSLAPLSTYHTACAAPYRIALFFRRQRSSVCNQEVSFNPLGVTYQMKTGKEEQTENLAAA